MEWKEGSLLEQISELEQCSTVTEESEASAVDLGCITDMTCRDVEQLEMEIDRLEDAVDKVNVECR